MKKIIAVLMTLAMILSMGAVMASALFADELPDIKFDKGQYGTSAEDFESFGNVKITWDPEAADKIDVTDGDVSEWAKAGYNTTNLTAKNMVTWVGSPETAPEGWSISTYFVADSDNLYIGFSITDPAFVYGNDPNSYNGDAFQVCIDFGGKIGKQLEIDPSVFEVPKNIFYSFSCNGDGQPLNIMRQEASADGMLTPDDGVVGSASKTADGWCAEFSMSFQRLFDDYAWKAWDEDAKIYMGSAENLPLNIGCCLYYLDRTETAGGPVNWAAASTNGITYEDGTPGVSFTAYDNGINLELDYVEGMEINCSGIVILSSEEETPEETEAPTEEATTEAPTEEATTEAPADEATTEAPADEATTEAPKTEDTTVEEKSGCGAVVGFGAVAVLAAAAAAVALKKKD